MEKNSTTTKGTGDATYIFQSSNNTMMHTFFGGLVLIIFVSTWISSLMSPVITFYAIKSRNKVLLLTIISITTAAYAPWKKSTITRICNSFVDTYHRCYYIRSSMKFQGRVPHPEETPTLYAVHPHGIFTVGWSLLFHSKTMAHVRFCFAPGLFLSPFFLLFSRLMGKPGKADKSSMISFMKKGESLALPPGGFEEATITCSLQDRVYIKKRKGFVKLCLMHGYSIVPVYCFGEKDTFWNVQGFWKFRHALNGMNIPAILFWGSKLMPLLPKRCELHVVAGEPISLPRIESPTRDQVEQFHAKYIEVLVKLYEENKIDAYGEVDGKDCNLEIW